MPDHEPNPERPQPGVLSYRIEHGEYIVSVCWRDEGTSELHFPVRGFPVIDPETKSILGTMTGPEALQALTDHAAHQDRDEFQWSDIISQPDDTDGQ